MIFKVNRKKCPWDPGDWGRDCSEYIGAKVVYGRREGLVGPRWFRVEVSVNLVLLPRRRTNSSQKRICTYKKEFADRCQLTDIGRGSEN